MSEYQRRIVYLSNEQKDELFENGSIVMNGVTYTYSDSDVYVTPTDEADIAAMLNDMIVEQVVGSDVTIQAKANTRYICGEVTNLTFTPPSAGTCDVIFTSGSTPTVVTLPSTVKMPEWYAIAANRTYEINISKGVYGVVTSWT